MPLQKRVVDCPFTAGPNDKLNPHLRKVTQLSLMENCFQQKTGEVRKRNGLAKIGKNIAGAGTLSAAYGLHNHDEHLLLEDGDKLYAWSQNNSKWKDLGACPSASVKATSISTGQSYTGACNVAGSGSYKCILTSQFTAEESSVYYKLIATVVDVADGVEILNTVIASGTTEESGDVAWVPGLNSFVVVYQQNGSNDLNAVIISNVHTSPIVGSPTTIRTDASAGALTPVFRVATAGTLEYAVAYENTSGNMHVRVFDLSHTLNHTYTGITTSPAGIDLFWQSTTSSLLFTYWDVKSLTYVRLDADLNVLTGPAAVETLGAGNTPMGGGLAAERKDGTAFARILYTVIDDDSNELYIKTATVADSGGAVSGVAVLVRNMGLISRANQDGTTESYALGYRSSPAQEAVDAGTNYGGVGTLYCFKASDGSLVARALVDQLDMGNSPTANGIPRDRTRHARNVFRTSDTVFSTVLQRAERVSVTPKVSSVDRYDTTFVDLEVDVTPAPSPSVDVADCLYLGAGILRLYDGNGCYIAGLEMPHPNFQANNVTGGGSMSDGSYGIALVYKWVDGRGREHYSAPTFITAETALGGSSQRLNIENPSNVSRLFFNGLTDKAQGLTVQLYRTKDGLQVHYFEEAIENDPTAFVSSVKDCSDTDATIEVNQTLYTTGGVLATVLPPTPHHLASDGETVALIPGDKRDTVWVSVPVVSGEGVRFTDDLVYDVPEGGDAEALWFMDGRLIVFKNKQIRYMLGRAPNAKGQGGYAGSELIDGSVGCESWRSVVRISQGILFKSSKGFYLLGRDLNTQYIGSPVESYNSQTVKSTALMEDVNQVRFCMSGGDVLVYDYDHGNWPRFPSMSLEASTVWGGKWTAAKSDAAMGQEDSSTWDDFGSSPITMKIRTGWLALASMMGWQRVRRLFVLGQSPAAEASEDELTLKTYVNYDDTNVEETLINGESMTSSNDAPIRRRETLGTQKMEALMVEMSAISTTDADSMRFTGISFECGVKKGAIRLSPARAG